MRRGEFGLRFEAAEYRMGSEKELLETFEKIIHEGVHHGPIRG
jgi:hypothetical protein